MLVAFGEADDDRTPTTWCHCWSRRSRVPRTKPPPISTRNAPVFPVPLSRRICHLRLEVLGAQAMIAPALAVRIQGAVVRAAVPDGGRYPPETSTYSIPVKSRALPHLPATQALSSSRKSTRLAVNRPDESRVSRPVISLKGNHRVLSEI